jgi:hypothetical protein
MQNCPSVERRSRAAPKGEPWVSTHGFQMGMALIRALGNPWADTHGSPKCAQENNNLQSSRTIVPIVRDRLRQLFYILRVNSRLPLALRLAGHLQQVLP